MSESRKQILEMLGQGKLTANEAERLISAFERQETAGPSSEPSLKTPAKYLRVVVETDEPGSPTKVNIRVPMKLLRAGVKLAGLIPVQARNHVNSALKDQGIELDLNQIKPENLEEIVESLNELTVDVDDPRNKVRIFCE